jgi:UPF0755 protein
LLKNLARFIATERVVLSRLYLYGVLPLCLGVTAYALIFCAVVNNFSTRPVTLTIEHNDPGTLILWKLQKAGVVFPRHNYKLAVRLSHLDRAFHAGRYTVNTRMPLQDIFATLMEQRGLSETSSLRVLIPEGISVGEVAEKLDSAGVISAREFLNYLKTADESVLRQKYSFLPKTDVPGTRYVVEGYLYPDTYVFSENTSANQVLDYMLYRFQQEAQPLFAKYPSQKYSPAQLLTLASIVEKEAEVQTERPVIAGVFLNRLKKWVHLGSCPTVKYALGNPRKKILLYKDLNVVSPYNTYRHYGLPPGPICSPGKASIMAALQPAVTDYMYFFARGDGTHIFSKTLEEHLQLQRELHHQQEIQ